MNTDDRITAELMRAAIAFGSLIVALLMFPLKRLFPEYLVSMSFVQLGFVLVFWVYINLRGKA